MEWPQWQREMPRGTASSSTTSRRAAAAERGAKEAAAAAAALDAAIKALGPLQHGSNGDDWEKQSDAISEHLRVTAAAATAAHAAAAAAKLAYLLSHLQPASVAGKRRRLEGGQKQQERISRLRAKLDKNIENIGVAGGEGVVVTSTRSGSLKMARAAHAEVAVHRGGRRAHRRLGSAAEGNPGGPGGARNPTPLMLHDGKCPNGCKGADGMLKTGMHGKNHICPLATTKSKSIKFHAKSCKCASALSWFGAGRKWELSGFGVICDPARPGC